MEEQRYDLGQTQSEIPWVTDFPVAIYGCGSWAMTSGDKKRVDAFKRWCYRRLRRVRDGLRPSDAWGTAQWGPLENSAKNETPDPHPQCSIHELIL